MPRITFAGRDFDVAPSETVLDCLTRHEVAVPSSCRSGICQSCRMQALTGTPPAAAQEGLRPALREQGHFLACLCKPEDDLHVALPGDHAHSRSGVVVVGREFLGPRVLRLRLRCEGEIAWRPGQFLNLRRSDGLTRSYSIASLPEEGVLELHVERMPGGRMSGWIHETLQVGERLEIEGPHGECYYPAGQSDSVQNLLLVATGCGLAPLWGIAHDALARGHRGELHLYHGSRNPEKLYLDAPLRRLASQYPNFRYVACLSGDQGAMAGGMRAGRADALALSDLSRLDGWRVFLCGHPGMVKTMKKKVFLAGAARHQIHADPFEFSHTC